jgi:hypothetical protein
MHCPSRIVSEKKNAQEKSEASLRGNPNRMSSTREFTLSCSEPQQHSDKVSELMLDSKNAPKTRRKARRSKGKRHRFAMEQAAHAAFRQCGCQCEKCDDPWHLPSVGLRYYPHGVLYSVLCDKCCREILHGDFEDYESVPLEAVVSNPHDLWEAWTWDADMA